MASCNVCGQTVRFSVTRCDWCREVFENGRFHREVTSKTVIQKDEYLRCDKAVRSRLLYPDLAPAPLLPEELRKLLSKAAFEQKKFTSWSLGWRIGRYRVAKYKQRRQLQTRAGMDFLEALADGACTALTLAWIGAHRANPLQTAGTRIESFNSDADFFRHNRTAASYNAVQGSHAARVEAAAPGDIANRHLTEADLTTFSATLARLTARPGYYIVTMEITNYPTSHVCALFADASGLVLFDPNFGEFKVQASNRAAFFLLLRKQYETYVSKDGVKTKLAFDNGWLFSMV